MPGLFHSISSAIRCISKSTDCDLLSIEESSVLSNADKNLNQQPCAKILTKSAGCGYEQLPAKHRQQLKENFLRNKQRSTDETMSDNVNNNDCPCLSSKEKKKYKKSYSETQFVRKNSTGHNTSENKQKCFADKTDLQNRSSKPDSASNDQPRTELSRQSSVSLPVVYTPPRIVKWPNHSSFREGGSKAQVKKTRINPPPNRTILKNDGRYIVSVSRRDNPCEHTGSKYVMEKQLADKQASDNLAVNLRMDEYNENDSTSFLSSSSRDELATRSNNRNFSYFPRDSHDDSPPEYSEPPNYYAIV